MRWWILFGCGVLVIAAAVWPFGRKTEQLGTVPMPPLVASKPAPAPKPEPAKIVEVIDLARAYEPVREPEEPAGAINPASFIQVPEGPKRIPPAVDLEYGLFPERIDVMPREVTWPLGWASCPDIPVLHGPLGFLPMPPVEGNDQLIAVRSFVVIPGDMPPVEPLKVMPREVK